jgi:hypothetical protein
MTRIPLNDHIAYAKPVQIARETTTRRMPALPLRQSCVPLESVVSALMFSFCFPARLTALQNRENHSPQQVIHAERLAFQQLPRPNRVALTLPTPDTAGSDESG